VSGVALGFIKRDSGKVNGLHSTSVQTTYWSPQPMLFDLDDAKQQFLHFYPLLTLNIEAPFASNVKVIMGSRVRGQPSMQSVIIQCAIC
jgi:hypothetical protein